MIPVSPVRALSLVLLVLCAHVSLAGNLTLNKLIVENHNYNVLRKQIAFQTSTKVSVSIVWWEVGKQDQPQLLEWDQPGTAHQFILRYLKAATSYQWYAETSGAKSEVQSFATDPLPQGMPTLTVEQNDASAHVDFVLANNEAKPAALFIFDREGHIRWYHLCGDYVRPFNWTDRGTVLGIRDHTTAFEVDMDGNELWSTTLPGQDGLEQLHHEITQGPDGLFYTFGKVRQQVDLRAVGGEANMTVGADRLIAFDSEGRIHWEWSLFRAVDPTQESSLINFAETWGHANGITFDPEGNVAISFRLLDQVWLINPRSSAVMARIGTNGTVTPDAQGTFLKQHTPMMDAQGRLLLFDNGEKGVRENSRIVLLQPDYANGIARTQLSMNIPQYLSSEKRSSVLPIDERQFLICTTGPKRFFVMSQRELILWQISSTQGAYRGIPIKKLP